MDEKAIQQFPVLRSAYGGLTKSERRIADYIVAAPEEIMEQTISDIAAPSYRNASEQQHPDDVSFPQLLRKLSFNLLFFD